MQAPSTLVELIMRVLVPEQLRYVYNTAQNRSDNLPPYPPDNHHSSDYVYSSAARDCKVLTGDNR